MIFSALRLLIVERDPVQQFAIQELAQNIDYEADCVPNGEEAIRYFANAEYASVLINLVLPDMSGFHCLSRLKRLESARLPVPFIAVADNTTPGIREKCLGQGFDELLIKPFSLETLRSTLLRWTCQWCLPGPADLAQKSGSPCAPSRSLIF